MVSPIIQEDVKNIIFELKDQIMFFEGKNIMITGANGMLASYLVYTLLYANKYLFKKPCQLYLITRTNNYKYGKEKFLHYIKHDIGRSKLTINVTLHYIIHAASKAAPKLYTQNLIDTLNTNIKGLYHVIDLASDKTKSILYFSSGEVYGQPEIKKPISEDYIGRVDHINKRSCYVEGKRAGETICMNYFWEKNFPIKIVRIFHTFGPGLNIEDGRVFSDFIRDGLNKNNIHIRGDKNMKRPLLYLKDATIMFFKVLLSDKNGQIYNISNNKNQTSVYKMAKIVQDIINKKNRKKIKITVSKNQLKYYKNAVQSIKPDISKFIKDFHYRPKTSVKEAFARTLASFN